MTVFAGTVADASIARPRHDPALVRRALHAVARMLLRKRTQRALGQLSDRTLKDIGMRRCEIDSIANSLAGGRWDATRTPRSSIGFRI